MNSTGGSYGDQRSILHVGPFVLSETRHARGFTTGRHVHERASLNLVLAGGYAETMAGSSSTVPAGGALGKPAWETHANDFRHAGARCLLLELPATTSALLREVTDVFDVPAPIDARDVLGTAAALRRAMRDSAAGGVDALLTVESLAYDIVMRLSRVVRATEERRPDAWLRRVRELLHDLPPSDITLARLGAEVGRHPAHVARTFHARHACTVGAYLRRLQIVRAAALLQHTDASISWVAAEVGLYDHSHLTRLFRQRTGLVPREYRLRHRATRVPETTRG